MTAVEHTAAARTRHWLPRLRTVILLILFVIAGGTTLTWGLVEAGRIEARLLAQEQVQLTLIADSVAAGAVQIAEVQISAAERLAVLIGGRTEFDAPEVQTVLDNHRDQLGLDILLVTDATFRSVVVSPQRAPDGAAMAGVDYADRDYVKAVAETGETALGAAKIGRVSGRINVHVGAPIVGADGEFRGLLTSSLKMASFHALAKRMEGLIPGARVVIFDRHGATLVDSWNRLASERDAPSSSAGRSTPLPHRALERFRDADGVEVFGVSVDLVGQRALGWRVVVTQPTEPILAEASTFRTRAYTAALIVLLVSIVFAIAVSGLLAAPFRRLAEYAERCKGAGPAVAEFPQTRLMTREAADLSVAVSNMVTRLAAHAANLKGQVVKRTSQMSLQADALRAANKEAWAASLAKSKFLANMSTELKRPLEGVIDALDTIGAGTAEDPAALASETKASARALLHLITDVLEMATIESGRLTLEEAPFDLQAAVRDVAALFRPEAEQRGLALTCDVVGVIPDVLIGDAARVRQAIKNLVSNAVKFTEAGSVRLTLSTLEKAGKARVRLDVADTGIGIAPALRDAIFGEFVQADLSATRSVGGTGLGLAITRQLADKMGGSVTVESQVGRGSVFTLSFTLPVIRRTRKRVAPITDIQIARARARGKYRVLLVEDNPINSMVAERMLKLLGAVVVTADDGSTALTQIDDEPFDCILMDCQMAVMDGYEATERIRAMGGWCEGVPIIAVTANAFPEDRAKCLAVGMNDHLAKPITRATLGEVMFRWIDQCQSDAGAAASKRSTSVATG